MITGSKLSWGSEQDVNPLGVTGFQIVRSSHSATLSPSAPYENIPSSSLPLLEPFKAGIISDPWWMSYLSGKWTYQTNIVLISGKGIAHCKFVWVTVSACLMQGLHVIWQGIRSLKMKILRWFKYLWLSSSDKPDEKALFISNTSYGSLHNWFGSASLCSAEGWVYGKTSFKFYLHFLLLL